MCKTNEIRFTHSGKEISTLILNEIFIVILIWG